MGPQRHWHQLIADWPPECPPSPVTYQFKSRHWLIIRLAPLHELWPLLHYPLRNILYSGLSILIKIFLMVCNVAMENREVNINKIIISVLYNPDADMSICQGWNLLQAGSCWDVGGNRSWNVNGHRCTKNIACYFLKWLLFSWDCSLLSGSEAIF